jgi:hypothetical protein
MIVKSVVCVLFTLLLIACGNVENFGQKGKIRLTLQDKREIIKMVLLDTDFNDALERTPDGTVYLSVSNIPLQIQNNFPEIKDVKFRFITPEEIEKLKLPLLIFQFDKFETTSRTVSLYFGSSFNGSGSTFEYVFSKSNGRWKIKEGGVQKIRLSMSYFFSIIRKPNLPANRLRSSNRLRFLQ